MHQKFVDFVPQLLTDKKQLTLFKRLARKAQMEKRFSVLAPSEDPNLLDDEGFYRLGHFPSTKKRMEKFEKESIKLMGAALEPILKYHKPEEFTHIVISSCTGFFAPGPDLNLVHNFGFSPNVHRSIIGFMGCYAGINAFKSAYQIVKADPNAKVLTLNLELCSLHLQESSEIEDILSFLLFSDGCAASVVTSEEQGIEIEDFACEVFSDEKELITWHIGDQGFLMHLDTQVPNALQKGISGIRESFFDKHKIAEKDLFAIHPGGRSILDSVQNSLEIPEEKMNYSRSVLRNYGNMSSPTVVFVLADMLKDVQSKGPGMALAFGPGLTVETMMFNKKPM